MTQIKSGIGEKTIDPVEKILLTDENCGVTKTNDTEEKKKILINNGKIV